MFFLVFSIFPHKYRIPHPSYLKVGRSKGDTLAFQVRKIQLFDRNADATTVFTSEDGLAHLNLITCEGIWNKVNDTYPERRVVFTDRISNEGAVAVKAPVISIFYRSLRIGARGKDVIALQTFLSQKGFLGNSPRVADGFFGRLTRAAVIKYQTSIGLSPDGVFGLLSRAKLVSEQSQTAVKPTFPSTAIIVPMSALSSSQVFFQNVKSLYATAIDAVITSLLIILIVFAVFKIILL